MVESDTVVTVHPNRSKHSTRLNFTLHELKDQIPNVVIKGLPTVNRAVIAREDKGGESFYNLCVEGDNLREVMATYGINGNKTISNNIIEVYNTLGIEAARFCLSGFICRNNLHFYFYSVLGKQSCPK